MKKRMIGLGLTILLVLSLMIGCTPAEAPQEDEDGESSVSEPIVLRIGHGTATDSLYHAGASKFKDLVEVKSDGQIKVELFPSGQLGNDLDLTEGMNLGTIEMGMIGLEPLTGIAPKMSVVNLPFLFPDRETAYRILDGEIGAEMAADLPGKHGIRVLDYFENGFRHVTNSKKPINTPEDLKGLKLRTPPSPVSLAIFKALGANPTPMAFGELYTALEQKTVDGQENPLALIYSSKFYEVQDYVSLTGHMYSPMALVISEKTWSKLSPELQQAVQEASNEARDYERQLSADQEAELVGKLEETGTKINKVDIAPFTEATRDVYLEFVDQFGADFYEKVMDAIKQ